MFTMMTLIFKKNHYAWIEKTNIISMQESYEEYDYLYFIDEESRLREVKKFSTR